MAPRFSVTIISFNGGRFLPECIRSILAGQFTDFEILVLNNGSSDDTGEIINSLPDTVRKFSVPKNLGFAGGVNHLLEKAAGEILISLNDDTVVEPQWLEELDRAFSSDPKIGVVGCKILDLRNGEKTNRLQHCGARVNRHGLTSHIGAGEEDRGQFEKTSEPDYLMGAGIAFRRELYEAIGGFPTCYKPIYYEENEFCHTARAIGYRVIYWPGAVLYHEGMQASGALSSRYFFRYHRNRIRFLLRNRTWRQLLRGAWEELRWLLSFRNRDQYAPLVRAYFFALLDFPGNLAGRRRLQKMRKRARGNDTFSGDPVYNPPT